MNVAKCYYCKNIFAEEMSYELYNKNARPILNAQRKLFCDDVCYNKYLDRHTVEEYNGQRIYGTRLDSGEQVFIPYVGCSYCFLDIDECRKRMDDRHIAVVSMGMLRFAHEYLN